MFGRYFLYCILLNLKAKEVIMWIVVFPMALGLMFKLAFSNVYESFEFKEIPVAVVENKDNPVFDTVIENLSGEEGILKPQYIEKQKAEELLFSGEIKGIFYVDDKISLSVSQSGVEQTILQSLSNSYIHGEKAIMDIMESSPEKLPDAIKAMSDTATNYGEETRLVNKEIDPLDTYFYNLVAMVCLCVSTAGVYVATSNQANLSNVGARTECSAKSKTVRILSAYLATILVAGACSILSVSYVNFVLGVSTGDLLTSYITGILGSIFGISLGFAVGSIPKIKETAKMAILTPLSLALCFLSGLMAANMKGVMEMYCPIVNDINPAAIICDMFSSMAVYGNVSGYIMLCVKLLIISAVCLIFGLLMTRRKNYADI